MKVGVEELAKNLPKALEAAGGGSPEWLITAENIVKGINDMIGFYNQLSDKPGPGNSPGDDTPKLGWSEAREMKKAEMAGRQGRALPAPPQSNEFQEVLAGLIKATATLAGMGFKDKAIGQVIMELPFTLEQTKDFLEKLYKSKYGG